MNRPASRIIRVALFALGLGAALNAGAAVIDDFTTNQGPLSVSPDGPTSDAATATGLDMIGGERDMLLSTDPGTDSFTSSAEVQSGAAVLANSSQFSSVLSFQWDGADGDASTLDATGLGGVNLTAGGLDAFEIHFLFDDLPATLDMNVYTDAGNVSTFSWPTIGTILTGTTMFVPFAVFTGSADFTNVGAIELLVSSPTNGLDLAIDYIHTAVSPVPAPTALLLFASALGLLGTSRRKA